MSGILVIGSANVDHLISVPRMPHVGETLRGEGTRTAFGGKGANQAVAAARLGGRVEFAGCVGDDAFGPEYIRHLQAEGVYTSSIKIAQDRSTGCAFIYVDREGRNSIVIVAGANADLTVDDVRALERTIAGSGVLLLQMEIPEECVAAAIDIAHGHGVKVILNAAPVPQNMSIISSSIDCLIVNEIEAAQIAGIDPDSADASPTTAAKRILERGVGSVIVTCGAEPALFMDHKQTIYMPTAGITPVDTVGAGDCFAGAMAVAMQEGMAPAQALAFANAAAALSTLKLGAQTAMPRRNQVDQLMLAQSTSEAHHHG